MDYTSLKAEFNGYWPVQTKLTSECKREDILLNKGNMANKTSTRKWSLSHIHTERRDLRVLWMP